MTGQGVACCGAETGTETNSLADADVLGMARNLVRMDTSNFGPGKSNGEEEATHYVHSLLEQAGLDCHVHGV